VVAAANEVKYVAQIKQGPTTKQKPTAKAVVMNFVIPKLEFKPSIQTRKPIAADSLKMNRLFLIALIYVTATLRRQPA
jgi:hypothetical protein